MATENSSPDANREAPNDQIGLLPGLIFNIGQIIYDFEKPMYQQIVIPMLSNLQNLPTNFLKNIYTSGKLKLNNISIDLCMLNIIDGNVGTKRTHICHPINDLAINFKSLLMPKFWKMTDQHLTLERKKFQATMPNFQLDITYPILQYIWRFVGTYFWHDISDFGSYHETLIKRRVLSDDFADKCQVILKDTSFSFYETSDLIAMGFSVNNLKASVIPHNSPNKILPIFEAPVNIEGIEQISFFTRPEMARTTPHSGRRPSSEASRFNQSEDLSEKSSQNLSEAQNLGFINVAFQFSRKNHEKRFFHLHLGSFAIAVATRLMKVLKKNLFALDINRYFKKPYQHSTEKNPENQETPSPFFNIETLSTISIKLQICGGTIIIPVDSSAVVIIPNLSKMTEDERSKIILNSDIDYSLDGKIPPLPVLYRMHSTGAHNPKLFLVNFPKIQCFGAKEVKNNVMLKSGDFQVPQLNFCHKKSSNASTWKIKMTDVSIYTTVSDEAKYMIEPSIFAAELKIKKTFDKLNKKRKVTFDISGQFQDALKIYVSSSQINLLQKLIVSVVELFVEMMRQIEREKPISKADLKRALSTDRAHDEATTVLTGENESNKENDSDNESQTISENGSSTINNDICSDSIQIESFSQHNSPTKNSKNYKTVYQFFSKIRLEKIQLSLNELICQNVQRKIDLILSKIDIDLEILRYYSKLKISLLDLKAMHFKKYLSALNADWQLGEFEGKLINANCKNKSAFENLLEIKFTRALTEHYLSVTEQFFESNVNLADIGGKAFLHEIIMNCDPIQVVVPIEILKSLETLIRPILLMKFPNTKTQPRDSKSKNLHQKLNKKGSYNQLVPPKNEPFATLGSIPGLSWTFSSTKELENKINFLKTTIQESLTRLPLIYFKVIDFEIYFPVNETTKTKSMVVAGIDSKLLKIHVNHINFSPEPENYLQRLIFDHEVYRTAEIDGILNVPSSPIEDRQYELQLIDLTAILIDPKIASNPDFGNFGNPETESPLLQKSNINLTIAPAMLERNSKRLICGHSLELKFLTDLIFSLNYEQIIVLRQFSKEFSNFISWIASTFDLMSDVKNKDKQELINENMKSPNESHIKNRNFFEVESTRADTDITFDLFTDPTVTSGHFSDGLRNMELTTMLFQSYLAPCEFLINFSKNIQLRIGSDSSKNCLNILVNQPNLALEVIHQNENQINAACNLEEQIDISINIRDMQIWFDKTPFLETKLGKFDEKLGIGDSLINSKLVLGKDLNFTIGRPVKFNITQEIVAFLSQLKISGLKVFEQNNARSQRPRSKTPSSVVSDQSVEKVLENINRCEETKKNETLKHLLFSVFRAIKTSQFTTNQIFLSFKNLMTLSYQNLSAGFNFVQAESTGASSINTDFNLENLELQLKNCQVLQPFGLSAKINCDFMTHSGYRFSQEAINNFFIPENLMTENIPNQPNFYKNFNSQAKNLRQAAVTGSVYSMNTRPRSPQTSTFNYNLHSITSPSYKSQNNHHTSKNQYSNGLLNSSGANYVPVKLDPDQIPIPKISCFVGFSRINLNVSRELAKSILPELIEEVSQIQKQLVDDKQKSLADNHTDDDQEKTPKSDSPPQNFLSSFTKNDFVTQNFNAIPVLHTVPLPIASQVHIYSGHKSSLTWCYHSPRSLLNISIPALALTSSILAATCSSDDILLEQSRLVQNVDNGKDDGDIPTEPNLFPNNTAENDQRTTKNIPTKTNKNQKSITCLLQYYNEAKPLTWSTFRTFKIYDNQPTILSNLAKLHDPTKICANQIWRIQMTPNDYFSLSPFTLHTNLQVDSCFCPDMAPFFELSLEARKLRVNFEDLLQTEVKNLNVSEFKAWKNGNNNNDNNKSSEDTFYYKLYNEFSVQSINMKIIETRGLCQMPFATLEDIEFFNEASFSKKLSPTCLKTKIEVNNLDLKIGQKAVKTLSSLASSDNKNSNATFYLKNRLADSKIYVGQYNTCECIAIEKLTTYRYYLYSLAKQAHLYVSLSQRSSDNDDQEGGQNQNQNSIPISLDIDGNFTVKIDDLMVNILIRDVSENGRQQREVIFYGAISFLNFSSISILNMPPCPNVIDESKSQLEILSCLPKLEHILLDAQDPKSLVSICDIPDVLNFEDDARNNKPEKIKNLPINLTKIVLSNQNTVIIISNKVEVISNLPEIFNCSINSSQIALNEGQVYYENCINEELIFEHKKHRINLGKFCQQKRILLEDQIKSYFERFPEESTDDKENPKTYHKSNDPKLFKSALQQKIDSIPKIIEYIKNDAPTNIKTVESWSNISGLYIKISTDLLVPTIKLKICPWLVIENLTNFEFALCNQFFSSGLSSLGENIVKKAPENGQDNFDLKKALEQSLFPDLEDNTEVSEKSETSKHNLTSNGQVSIPPKQKTNCPYFDGSFTLKIGAHKTSALTLRKMDKISPDWSQKRYSDSIAIYENSKISLVFGENSGKYKILLTTSLNKNGILQMTLSAPVLIENLCQEDIEVKFLAMDTSFLRADVVGHHMKSLKNYHTDVQTLSSLTIRPFEKIHNVLWHKENETKEIEDQNASHHSQLLQISQNYDDYLALIIFNFYLPLGQICSHFVDKIERTVKNCNRVSVVNYQSNKSYAIASVFDGHQLHLTIKENSAPSFFLYNDLNYSLQISESNVKDSKRMLNNPNNFLIFDPKNPPIITLNPGVANICYELVKLSENWPIIDLDDENLSNNYASVYIRYNSNSDWSKLKVPLMMEKEGYLDMVGGRILVKSEWINSSYHVHFTDAMGYEGSCRTTVSGSSSNKNQNPFDNSSISIKKSNIIFYNNESTIYQEILRATLQKIDLVYDNNKQLSKAYIFHPSEIYQLNFSIQSCQIDNQMYNENENFDFPVIYKNIIRNGKGDQKCLSVNFSVSEYLEVIDAKIEAGDARIFIEDKLVYRLVEYGKEFVNLMSRKNHGQGFSKELNENDLNILSTQATLNSLLQAFKLKNLKITETEILVSARNTTGLEVFVDNSPVKLPTFSQNLPLGSQNDWLNVFRKHYKNAVIYSSLWLLAGVDVFFSPVSIFHGAKQGMEKFRFTHMAGGFIRSISNFSGAIARNANKYSLDQTHILRNQQLRRKRPVKISSGISQGVSSLALSILGAASGLVQMPIESIQDDNNNSNIAVKIAGGLSKGLVGLFTKPVAGVAQLISQTGQGLLEEIGLKEISRVKNDPAVGYVRQWSKSSSWYRNKLEVDFILGLFRGKLLKLNYENQVMWFGGYN